MLPAVALRIWDENTDSVCWQHTPRINGDIPDVNDATLDHGRLSERLQILACCKVINFLFQNYTN